MTTQVSWPEDWISGEKKCIISDSNEKGLGSDNDDVSEKSLDIEKVNRQEPIIVSDDEIEIVGSEEMNEGAIVEADHYMEKVDEDGLVREPSVGMEYASLDDAQSHYNAYARQMGFGTRISRTRISKGPKEIAPGHLFVSGQASIQI